MSRTNESIMIVLGSILAGFAVVLVEFAADRPLGAGTVPLLVITAFLIAFGGIQTAIRRFAPEATTNLIAPIIILTALGYTEIHRLDPSRALLQRWWLIITAVLAIGVLAFVSRVGLSALRTYRNITLLAAVVLLLLPMLPSSWPLPLTGREVNGSRLWIQLSIRDFVLSFQPAEVAKLLLVVFLAGYLADRQHALTGTHRRVLGVTIPGPRQLVPLLAVWPISLAVLVFQRDLGASLLLFSLVVAMLYAATGSGGFVTGGVALTLLGGGLATARYTHVQRRIVAWLNPFSDPLGDGYQISQGLFALGSGSITGSGPGLGRPDLIPYVETDFIFAAVAEEFGFAGSAIVIACYMLLVGVGFGIALRSRDRFRKLLAAGLTFILGAQVFLILGGILRLVPLTGIALPFMSYGGSSLLGNMILVVLLARISHEETPV